jgi:hypothetical protein
MAPVSRLAVLSRQVAACTVEQDEEQHHGLNRASTRARDADAGEARPLPGGGKGNLIVVDSRTGKKYTVSKVQCACVQVQYLACYLAACAVWWWRMK